MKNQIVINIPEGKKAVQETDKDGNIIIKYVDVEPTRSKSWEEFCERHPYATGEFYFRVNGVISKVSSTDGVGKRSYWDICMASKEDAEGILALIKLTRLHDEWVGDWKPDYSEDKVIWQIYKRGNFGEINVLYSDYNNKLLSFPTHEMAQEFLDCFKDLIEKAKKFI